MKYKAYWNGIIRGFFSDTNISGIDIVEADNELEAIEKAKKVAERLSYRGRVIFAITDVTKLAYNCKTCDKIEDSPEGEEVCPECGEGGEGSGALDK